MSTLYLDTSALVKCYLAEVGSSWLRALLARDPMPTALVSHLALVEGVCVFARRRREGLLPSPDYLRVMTAFEYDFHYRYESIAVEPVVIDAARQMADRNPLRAYDAVQLATAWLANRELIQAGRSPLTFISADDRLLVVALSEGLLTGNPNHHP